MTEPALLRRLRTMLASATERDYELEPYPSAEDIKELLDYVDGIAPPSDATVEALLLPPSKGGSSEYRRAYNDGVRAALSRPKL